MKKFGEILGTVFVENNVPVHIYSNEEFHEHEQFHTWNGFYGLKWECVEFARRYLYLASGGTYVLPYVVSAADLWDVLPPNRRFCNVPGNLPHLQKRSVLIFGKEKNTPFEETGHVAIAMSISDSSVEIAEQNMDEHMRTIDVSNENMLLGWFNLLQSE